MVVVVVVVVIVITIVIVRIQVKLTQRTTDTTLARQIAPHMQCLQQMESRTITEAYQSCSNTKNRLV